ncbi:MAG: ammonium transporter [Acidimicrobiales bacterium]|nr:ammonium transporter [Actinomycetota bacterium]
MLGTLTPYPNWLNTGDNTWQLVAATLVGLMSIPGLAVLYGGLVQKKWAVNTMLMAFAGFSIVLIVWVLWAFNMAFGHPIGGHGFFGNMVGMPHPIVSHFGEQNRANIPLVSGTGAMPPFHYPTSTLAYFQFVFAAITPLLFLGSVMGRMKFKAWLLLVPLWTTFVYAINAFMLWGGGWFAQQGALDYSGGYVIHLSAGVSGFVAAAIVGPRLKRDRQHGVPNNLLLVAVGAGILWLGWNGFNGGDPYFAGADAAAAVINTNLATAAALLMWVFMDMRFSKQRKPTLLGAVNGMICGLVAITPSAGWVDGYGAIIVGIVASGIVWVAWTYLPRIRPFSKVDDALGVVYTHGIAGLAGGLLLGFLGDPGMVEYLGKGKTASFSVNGLFYTGSWHQVWEQLVAGVWVICFSAVMTAVLCLIVKKVVGGLRMSDEELETGDLAVHDEEVYPPEPFAERVGVLAAASRAAEGTGEDIDDRSKP